MKNWLNNFKLDKVNENGAAGTPATPPADAKPPTQQPPKAEHPALEESGNNVDDLGYDIEPPAGTPPKDGPGDKKPADKKPADKKAVVEKKVETPATGYAGEPPKVEDEPPPPKAPPAEPPALDDFDKVLDGLGEADKLAFKGMATKTKLTPDQLKELAVMRKQEIKAANDFTDEQTKSRERQVMQQRATWHKELKEDKDFGGENFDKSVAKAEQVLEEFFPLTKKALTEHKTMLPPYYMRDLAKLAEHMFGNKETLVTGDPATPPKEKEESDDALSFYE